HAAASVAEATPEDQERHNNEQDQRDATATAIAGRAIARTAPEIPAAAEQQDQHDQEDEKVHSRRLQLLRLCRPAVGGFDLLLRHRFFLHRLVDAGCASPALRAFLGALVQLDFAGLFHDRVIPSWPYPCAISPSSSPCSARCRASCSSVAWL